MAGKCCKGFRASSRGGVGYYDVPLEQDSAEGLLLRARRCVSRRRVIL